MLEDVEILNSAGLDKRFEQEPGVPVGFTNYYCDPTMRFIGDSINRNGPAVPKFLSAASCLFRLLSANLS